MAADFPRIYRASLSNKAVMYVLGGICAGAGALGAWYFGGGHDPKTQGSAAIILAVLSGLFFLLGAYLIYSIAHFRITLTTDAIDVQQLGASRSYARGEFSGWRIRRPSKGPNILELAFRDSAKKTLKISQYFALDDVFWEWLARLDDLDTQERTAAEREIAENQDLGLTAEERLSKLRHARRISTVLTVVTVIACAWAWVYPYPYWLTISVLAVIPWAALWVAGHSHGLFRIDDKRNDPHPNVAIAFMMPGFILALRGADVHLMNWQAPLVLTVVI